MRGGLNTKMLPLFGTQRLMDGEGKEGGNYDLEGQRSRVEAGEGKMSSVASTPFFTELLPPLDKYKHYTGGCTNTHTLSIFNTASNCTNLCANSKGQHMLCHIVLVVILNK